MIVGTAARKTNCLSIVIISALDDVDPAALKDGASDKAAMVADDDAAVSNISASVRMLLGP